MEDMIRKRAIGHILAFEQLTVAQVIRNGKRFSDSLRTEISEIRGLVIPQWNDKERVSYLSDKMPDGKVSR